MRLRSDLATLGRAPDPDQAPRLSTAAIIALRVLGGSATSMAGESSLAGATSLFVRVYCAVAALGVYVFMGGLQQTLLMLVGITKSSARDDFLSRC
jgi:hypothetical protein